MGRKLSIALGFILYVIAGFFMTRFIIQRRVDVETKFIDDFIDSLALAAYYAFTGYGVYFFVIIATAIGGWIISRRLNDTEATSTFKGLTVFTVGFALLFFVYALNQ